MSRIIRNDRTSHPEDLEARLRPGSHIPEDSEAVDLEDADAELDEDQDDEDDGEDTAIEERQQAGHQEEAPAEEDYASGPDDALGLYLRQMGSIPLLNRQRELDLAQRLEYHRNRFRSATLL